ncbi:hypothetical protein TNCV_3107061 [Trichonephila clavipes]|nr:hypothetical protein TNCV_3107061 [Trichonephila clavipes]
MPPELAAPSNFHSTPMGGRFRPDIFMWFGPSTRRAFNGQAFVAYPHRPMTLHSPTEHSLAVLNHKIFGGQFTGPKREIRRSPNVSFNKSIVA